MAVNVPVNQKVLDLYAKMRADRAAGNLQGGTGANRNVSTVPTPPTTPRASQEVMDIRMATRPDQWGGSVPSPVGDAYKAMNPDQKKQFQLADGAGQDRIAKSLVPTPPVQPPPTAMSSTTVPVPPGAINPNSISQEAKYRLDAERAALKTAADQKLAGLKANANYQNQNIADQRVLSNLMFARQNDPSNGRTGYTAANIQRGRDIDDTYRESTLNANLNAIESELFNFDKLAPAKQQEIINQLTRLERDFALQEGQLTGNYNGGRTLAGQQMDYNKGRDAIADERYNDETQWSRSPENPAVASQQIANQINQLKLQNLPQEIALGLTQLQQQVQSGAIGLQQAEYQMKELTDPNSFTNRSNELAMQAQRLGNQELAKRIEQIGKMPVEDPLDQQYRQKQIDKIDAEIKALGNKAEVIEPKESADNLSGAKKNIVDDGLNYNDAMSYAQGIKEFLSDSDYKSLLNYIDNEFN